ARSAESCAARVSVEATDVIVTLPSNGTRDVTATLATPGSAGKRSASVRRSVATRSGVYVVPFGYSTVTRRTAFVSKPGEVVARRCEARTRRPAERSNVRQTAI